DKGVLNDGEGRTVDFKNTVIILTSNLATDVITQMFQAPEPPTIEAVRDAIKPVLTKHFKPALLARMSVVPYVPIQREILKDIASMKLNSLAGRLHASHRIKTEFAPEVIEEFARRCTDMDAGARNVDHVLRASLMPQLSRELLEQLASGSTPTHLHVGLSPSGEWDLAFTQA
ncbi:MAG TPA: AAA family ATPase, partial [Hyalangium sp.]|nr:AAA family ATPase [Hyalangium sp.]